MTTKKGVLLMLCWPHGGKHWAQAGAPPGSCPGPQGLNMQASLTDHATGTPLPVQRPSREKDAGHQPRAGCGVAYGEEEDWHCLQGAETDTDTHISSSMGDMARAAGEGQPCPLPHG